MKSIVIVLLLTILASDQSKAQNAPFSLWGSGLDGSTYQMTVIYSDATNGLLFEAPVTPGQGRLPIAFSWRGGGLMPLYIQPTGNIGIGTLNPLSQLDVFHPGTGSDLRVGGYATGTSNDAGIDLYAQNGSSLPTYARIALGVVDGTAGRETGYINFSTINTGTLSERMRITNSGNVGIGTTTPSANLDVSGVNSGIQITGTNISSLNFSSPKSFANINTYNDGTLRFHTSTNWFDSADNQFVLIAGGNVGVGTTDSKGYKFAVNGSAIATSMTVKLYASWPDYVFKPAYKLTPLKTLKNYIDQNHHLPEIPSEQQIARDGLNLGEMNKLLMKKVEELTLYLIEKDQQVRNGQAKNNELESKLNAQQAEIDQMKKQLESIVKQIHL